MQVAAKNKTNHQDVSINYCNGNKLFMDERLDIDVSTIGGRWVESTQCQCREAPKNL